MLLKCLEQDIKMIRQYDNDIKKKKPTGKKIKKESYQNIYSWLSVEHYTKGYSFF